MTNHRSRAVLFGTGAFAAAVLLWPAAASAQTAPTAPAASVSFTKDIAPILQRSCQNCHRPGAIAPMSLMTYEDVRPWGRAVRRKVVAREMPPWHIDRNVGIQKFKNDISLKDSEISTIAAWVDAGMPKGNPSDAPAPIQFPSFEAWQIGTPDLVVQMPQEYTVRAEGGDQWIEFFAPTGLTEDRYIKAVQGMPGPGSHTVVHHLTSTVIQPPEENILGSDDNETVEQFLNEYAVGKNGDVFPDGTARVLKAGSIVKFQLHYHSSGEEIRDRSRIGFVFYPKDYKPKYYVISRGIGNADNPLDIPAGEVVRYDGYHVFNRPVRLASIQAHMHNRGKRMCVEAIYPTGKNETLNCFNFDFAWHKNYQYDEDVTPLLPAGTVLHIYGWHDNSKANRNNPDPRNWTGQGNRTIDEMGFLWAAWSYLTEEDFNRMVAERNAAKGQKTQQ
jgi:hypothetical protein